MLVVMLFVVLPKRFNVTSIAGAAWFTWFNEKTICGYRKEERRGKHKRLSLYKGGGVTYFSSFWSKFKKKIFFQVKYSIVYKLLIFQVSVLFHAPF